MEKDSNEYKTDLDSEACYRACLDAGMTDPEKTIPAMVEALNRFATLLENYRRVVKANIFAAAVKKDESERVAAVVNLGAVEMELEQVNKILATLNDESEVGE